MLLANLWFIRLQGEFPILRTRSFPDVYPPGCPLALGRLRILIPGCILSPPTLAVYDVAHSLPLGDTGRDFPFTEDETWRHFSYLSGTSREFQYPMKRNLIKALTAEIERAACVIGSFNNKWFLIPSSSMSNTFPVEFAAVVYLWILTALISRGDSPQVLRNCASRNAPSSLRLYCNKSNNQSRPCVYSLSCVHVYLCVQCTLQSQ